MNPADHSPLQKLNIFQLVIGLIVAVIIVVATSNWFFLHSLLFNVGATDHGHRQRILLNCMELESEFLLPSSSWESEELKMLAKIVDHFNEICKEDFEKVRKLGEEKDRILEELEKIDDKQIKLSDEIDQIHKKIQQRAGQHEEVAKLKEKCEQIKEEKKRLNEVYTQLDEELQGTKEEYSKSWGEYDQNFEMSEHFYQEWRRRLLEEERKKDMHITCRAQYNHYDGDGGYYGDSD